MIRTAALCLAMTMSAAAWGQPAPDSGPGYPPPPAGTGGPPPGAMAPGGPGPAPAMAPHAHMPMKERFDAANSTHDGRLTLAQAQAANWRIVVNNFAAIDVDHKGYVTMQDLKQFRQERHAERQAAAHGQAPGGPPAGYGAPGAGGPPPGAGYGGPGAAPPGGAYGGPGAPPPGAYASPGPNGPPPGSQPY